MDTGPRPPSGIRHPLEQASRQLRAVVGPDRLLVHKEHRARRGPYARMNCCATGAVPPSSIADHSAVLVQLARAS